MPRYLMFHIFAKELRNTFTNASSSLLLPFVQPCLRLARWNRIHSERSTGKRAKIKAVWRKTSLVSSVQNGVFFSYRTLGVWFVWLNFCRKILNKIYTGLLHHEGLLLTPCCYITFLSFSTSKYTVKRFLGYPKGNNVFRTRNSKRFQDSNHQQ